MEDSPATAPTPVMDVVAPPPAAKASPTPTSSDPPAKPPAPAQKAPKAPAKQSVTVAIFATVIIVLGLAALAVYAYLKSR